MGHYFLDTQYVQKVYFLDVKILNETSYNNNLGKLFRFFLFLNYFLFG